MSELGQVRTLATYRCHVCFQGQSGRNRRESGHSDHSLDNPSYQANEDGAFICPYRVYWGALMLPLLSFHHSPKRYSKALPSVSA
jgi:hypothetical protein